MESIATPDQLREADQRYEARSPRSRAMHDRAEQVFPGGSISSVRAFRNFPLYVHRAEGARLYDVDGNVTVDFMNANASVMLGHAHPGVTAAVSEQVARGLAFQLPGDNAVDFAELLRARTPSLERLRFTCSGTEATMYGFRLARVFTGRRRLLFMDGSYSGFHELGSVGDGPNRGEVMPNENPARAVAWGVDPRVADDVEFAHFNDLQSCREKLDAHPGEYAAVVVEPILGAGGNIPAEPGFLSGLRALCDRESTLLFFDETISYSISRGASQGHYGVRPDLTTAGKSIANGMPVGLFGGRADIMALAAPTNGRARLQHSSSFAAHPIVMAAGAATLRAYDDTAVRTVDELGEYMREGLRELLRDEGVVGQVTGLQHLFGLHLTPSPVRRYAEVRELSPQVRGAIAFSLLSKGYLMSGHRGALNAATTTEDIDGFLAAMRATFRDLRLAG